MLDPRHKHLAFLTPAQREEAKAKLIELGEAVDDVEVEAQPGGDADPDPAAVGQASAMALLLGPHYSAAPAVSSVEVEVENFIRDFPPGLDTNPIKWWTVNAGRFPRLKKLARQYLAIPATSVPSERVFSAAGLIVTRLRSRLTPEHVDMLIFLNKN